jgi:hypothetical protein
MNLRSDWSEQSKEERNMDYERESSSTDEMAGHHCELRHGGLSSFGANPREPKSAWQRGPGQGQ